jgi:hypothetical protein
MLSLTNLHKHFFKLWALSINDGLSIKVNYHKKVYLLTIQPTGEYYTRVTMRQSARDARRKKAVSIKIEVCPTCEGVVAGGICLNRRCDSKIKIQRGRA